MSEYISLESFVGRIKQRLGSKPTTLENIREAASQEMHNEEASRAREFTSLVSQILKTAAEALLHVPWDRLLHEADEGFKKLTEVDPGLALTLAVEIAAKRRVLQAAHEFAEAYEAAGKLIFGKEWGKPSDKQGA